jgi:hypothetical protein
VVERVGRESAIRVRRAAHETDAIVAPHQDDVEHLEREAVVDRVALRHVAEAHVRRGRHRPPAAERASRGWRAGSSSCRRRWADEPEEVAGGDVERDVGKHHATPVAERRVFERDERGHRTAAASWETSYFMSET